MVVTLLLAFAVVELIYSRWTNSLALVASAFFDVVDAVVLLIGAWGHTLTSHNRASALQSYGFDRYEVLLRFGASTYMVFVCLWVFFEGVERVLEVEPTFIHGSYMVQVGVVGIVLQVVHTVMFRKYALTARNALTAGYTYFALAWEFIADVLVVCTGLLIRHRGYFMVDTVVALFLTTLIAFQMIPVVKDSALLLLLASPPTVPTSKILHEVGTIDGVVEVKKEHFWSTGPTTHIGTLRVRVRSEVDEKGVLTKISELCAPWIHHLTVQIEKENWDMPSRHH